MEIYAIVNFSLLLPNGQGPFKTHPRFHGYDHFHRQITLFHNSPSCYNLPMQNHHSQPIARGYLTAVMAAIFLSTTAIFIRYLTHTYQLPALILAFWRDVFTVMTLSAILIIKKPALLSPGRKNIPYLIVYGLLLALFNATWTLSVSHNGAAIATVLVYCSTAFGVGLGWLFLKEALTWVKLSAVILVLIGCALVAGLTSFSTTTLSPAGIIIGLLSGLCYACYSLLGRKASQNGINPWTTLLYTFGFAALFLLIPNLLHLGSSLGTAESNADLFWLGGSSKGWLVLFLLAAVPTLGGFGLYNVSLTMLTASITNLIVSLEPVFTAIVAYLLLGERMNPRQITGGSLIVLAVILLRTYDTLKNRRRAPNVKTTE